MKKPRDLPCRVGCSGKRAEDEFLCPSCYYKLPQDLRQRLYSDKTGQSHRKALKLLRGDARHEGDGLFSAPTREVGMDEL